MKLIKTNNHPDDILKNALELDHIPQQVSDKLHQLYFELPDPLPTAYRPSRLKAACISVSTVAAAVLLLLGLNVVNPAFAEEIPFIGGIFRQINMGGYDADTVDTQRLEKHAVVPGTESSQSLTAENDAYGVTVERVYFDGKFLHSALTFTSDIDIREANQQYATVLINGETVYAPENNPVENTQAMSTPYIQWVNTGSNSYVANFKFAVPEKYQTGEPLQVEYVFSIPSELGQHSPASVSFTATPDSTEAIDMPITCESAGAVLSDFYTSPAGTEIAIRVPNESDYGAYAKLYTEDGKEISQLQTGSNHISADSESEFIDSRLIFSGLKEEYTRVVLQVYINEDDDDQSIYRMAEFTIDTENQTITATENYQDKNSILYSNFALNSLLPSMFPTYRAPDAALALSSGYGVEYISSGGLHKSAYLTFVTPDDYRDLRVEMYVNDQLRTIETTKQESQDDNCFMAFSDYVYDPHGISTLEDGRLFFLDSGNIQRPDEVKKNLNIQILNMGDVFFQMEDVVTIKIYDAASNELLHEETQTLTLPENAEMPEGSHLYKQSSLSSYVFANPDDLP